MSLFRRKANRVCVRFGEGRLVPVAGAADDVPVFDTAPPERIGDDAIVYVEGRRRRVRLLMSSGNVVNSLYLVDMGPA